MWQMTKLINRPQYLNQLIQHKDVDLVKIVTGIRRCGKSSLLDLLHQYLLDHGVPESRIIHMNMESLRYRKLTDYLAFYDHVSAQLAHGPSKAQSDAISEDLAKGQSDALSDDLAKSQSDGFAHGHKTYLIFDELQAVEHWEKAIESFRIDFNVDIYITGFNAYLLSTEFATMLSGRFVEIKMLPLSFSEFLKFYDFASDLSLEQIFQRFLQFGGMPVLREYRFNEPRSMQALEGIYSTVVLRDVLQRNPGADQATLQKIMLFLCSNIGSITSPNSMGKSLSNEGDIPMGKQKSVSGPSMAGKTVAGKSVAGQSVAGKTVAGKTVDKYISMLLNALVFFQVGRYDVKGKQLLKTLGKYYISDLGLRNMLLGYRDADTVQDGDADRNADWNADRDGDWDADRGHILENVVFLELLRRDYRVYIGKVNEFKVDFVAEKPDNKVYIQVTESMQVPETRNRELRPLCMIPDNYEKIVLSMDRNFITSYNGIKSLNLIDWLLEK